MKFAEKFERAFRLLLPSPFTIAVLLTLLTFVLAFVFGHFNENTNKPLQILDYWYQGIWNAPLLVFALQMMLILVLGHTLALAKPISQFIEHLSNYLKTPAQAAFTVCFCTLLVAFFNWGLGLIFGAILARKTGEHFARNNLKINYAVLGAAGYSGLMVWHGGLSGSAPVKVIEPGHLTQLMGGILNPSQLALLPTSIPFNQTIFSSMNFSAAILLLLILPSSLAWLAHRSSKAVPTFPSLTVSAIAEDKTAHGAERLDKTKWLGSLFGLLILAYCFSLAWRSTSTFGFITLNFLNFSLLGLGLIFHQNIRNFLKALDDAIGGASGILVQFPLYFGIMGIMSSSGLIQQISDYFISIASPQSFPILSLFSAGLVNIFVPSGGGQWAIQGPILVTAAQNLGVALPKSIMALAYGDQLTNMLQPFWALPLLAITGLKAKEIIPYTLILMGLGILIFVGVLMIF